MTPNVLSHILRPEVFVFDVDQHFRTISVKTKFEQFSLKNFDFIVEQYFNTEEILKKY
jgi:hypothetical protein